MATDLAEWLVRQGVPFREAHHQVGSLVGYCARSNKALDKVSLDEMRQCIPNATEECLLIFNPDHSIAARKAMGGTALENVESQIAYWQNELA